MGALRLAGSLRITGQEPVPWWDLDFAYEYVGEARVVLWSGGVSVVPQSLRDSGFPAETAGLRGRVLFALPAATLMGIRSFALRWGSGFRVRVRVSWGGSPCSMEWWGFCSPAVPAG